MIEIKKESVVIDNEVARKHVLDLIANNTDITVTIEPTKRKRTSTQNRCIHKYCKMLADELNTAGFDMRVVLSHHAEITWSMDSVKEKLWKPVQKALINKDSTTDQNTAEVSAVYEQLSRHLSQSIGVYVPWPSRFGDEG